MRKLVNIYSPSTYIDSEIRENNELMAIYIESYKCPNSKKNDKFLSYFKY